MTSSLHLLQFHSILADPKDMHSAEKARLEMLLGKIAVFQWARWLDPILQPIHQAQQANLRGKEGERKRTGRRHLIAHFLTCWLIQEILEPGTRQGFPKGARNCAFRQLFNSLKCQLCSEVCSLLHDTLLEEEGRKGQHCMTDVLVPG